MASRSGAPPLPARLQRLRAIGVAQPTPRLLATLSASLVPLGDRLPLLLRHQRHDPHREVVRLRQVTAEEVTDSSRLANTSLNNIWRNEENGTVIAPRHRRRS